MLVGSVVVTIYGAAQPGVAINGSQAAFTTSTPSVGSHAMTAAYLGDGSFNASTSAALNQTVNQANTTVAVSASADPSTFGQSVMFTAAVASSAGTPTGTVTFTIDGVSQPSVN